MMNRPGLPPTAVKGRVRGHPPNRPSHDRTLNATPTTLVGDGSEAAVPLQRSIQTGSRRSIFPTQRFGCVVIHIQTIQDEIDKFQLRKLRT
jgi:hypothetical protein